MSKQDLLNKLNIKWAKDCDCPLKKSATQPVFGDGSVFSKIVFVGEAPGKSEDKCGTPFIGASGKFLSEMLSGIKLKREDVYITNIVKYRPPNNRDPAPLEKKACEKWLYEELNLIEPKLVIFLGRHSMNNFFPELKISEAHGRIIHKKIDFIKTEYFLPLYHPAAALYNGKMREVLKKDFGLVSKILKKIG